MIITKTDGDIKMDERLDFYNFLNEYFKKLTEDDTVLVLSYNKKEGDCINFLRGDWSMLSLLFSEKEVINFDNGDEEMFIQTKKAILNIAYNICMKDEEIKSKFINSLK